MKYRNISEQSLVVIGFGQVEAGKIIDVGEAELNNTSFEPVEETKSAFHPKQEVEQSEKETN